MTLFSDVANDADIQVNVSELRTKRRLDALLHGES
jgi:hypothetical protein